MVTDPLLEVAATADFDGVDLAAFVITFFGARVLMTDLSLVEADFRDGMSNTDRRVC